VTRFLNQILRLFGLRAVVFSAKSQKQRKIDLHRQLAKELGLPFRGMR